MSQLPASSQQYTIRPAVLADSVAIGEAHLKAWIESYPNDEYGITEEWIKDELGFLASQKGVDFRQKTIRELDDNVRYEVVEDAAGIVQGFMHVSKTHSGATLDAIYLTEKLKGSGAADVFMEHITRFTQGVPIVLETIMYNQRAIHFYEKHRFVKENQPPTLFHDKIPIIKMKREVQL